MARLSPAEAGLLLMLLLALVIGADSAAKKPKILRRTKRTWILPPAKIKENTDYTHLPFIAKIRSDKDQEAKVKYFLTGEGANMPPYNLFVVDHETGFVRITSVVDRETHPHFSISGVAKFANGSMAEPEIPLVVTILDENDNPPYFELHSGNITEASKQGTFVMQIEGKDKDQQGTINSQIAYSIVSQEPEGTHMFRIDEMTGKLYVKEPTLDRETIDFYRLVVKGTDLGGQPSGLTGTGTVEIHVLDINDNIPTLEHSEYTGSVDENVHDVVVMRIKALDKDLEHTDNWLTVFKINKGNEDNLFSIETDEETNEGVLKLIKPVDFEDIQNLEISLIIENVAPFVEGSAVEMDVDVQVGEGHRPNVGGGGGVSAGGGAGVSGEVHGSIDAGMGGGLDGGLDVSLEGNLDGGVSGGLSGELEGGLSGELHPEAGPGPGGGSAETSVHKSYPIKITVNNVPEGPAFMPETKEVPVSEDPDEQPEDGIIAEFTATDPDTGKPAEDVTYAKAYDPDNWFVIDEETAEIKLNKQPDRESPFLVDGTYFAKILAISKDTPSKTVTGTIAIKVTDSNDHCPTLTTTHTSLCSDKKTVYVTAFDEDQTPNAAPFTFTVVPDGTRGSWDMELINETTAALHSSDSLWPGVYELQVKVADAQGHSCPADEVFTVSVCTCVDTDDCSQRAAKQTAPSSKLSAAVIGPLLLAMCLLLLIPLLLLFCQCGGADSVFPDHFHELPFDAKEHLISYHTEGRGEDKEVPLHSVPIMLENQKKVEMAPAIIFNAASKFTETQQSFYNETVQQFQEASETIMAVDNAYGMQRESFKRGNSLSRRTFAMQSSSDMFDEIALSNDFLDDYFTQKAMCAEPSKDVLLDYGFEGQGSPAGSLGCCSLPESENDLQFLNDLGPKFKTLAEICSPPKPTSLTHKVASAVSTTQIHSPPPAAPKASLTSKVAGAVSTTVDLVQPVVKPKIEQSVETKHTDIKVETVVSSSNTSQSSVSTAPPTIVLPQSQVTGLSHTSNIVQAATLPRPGQAVVLQQQPVYYTTGAVLQPMQYVVQPQIQNTVLLTNSTHGDNIPGLYVVSGPQNAPSSGLVMSTPQGLVMTQGPPSGLVIQGTESPKSPVSPISPVSPTVLLPVGSVVPQGSVSAEGWKMVGPNPVGNFTLVKDKISPTGMQLVAPGSSQDILPGGAILVKEAAPPQGALSPAAQGSVFGPLPKHTIVKRVGVVAVKEPGCEGQSNREGLETVIIGPPQMGLRMGHTVTLNPEVSQERTWPVVIGPPAIGKVSVNQFQQIPPQKQATDGGGVRKTRKIRSPKKEKDTCIEKTITAKTTKSHQPSKIKTVSQEESHLVHNAHIDKADEKQNVIAFESEQLRKLNDKGPDDFVKSEFEDKVSIQEYQTEGKKPQEDTVKTLSLNVLETSPEQSVHDELIIISKASSDKFNDEINQEKDSSDTEEEVVPPKNKAEEKMSVDTDMSSTEFIPGPVVSESDNEGREKEGILTADHIDTVEDQAHNSSEESVGNCEAVACENEALEKEDESIELTVGESFEDRQINDSQDPNELVKDLSLDEKVVEDFETCGVTVAPEPTEEEVEESTAVTTEELSTVGGEVSASLPTKILATTESEANPSVAQETTLELPTDDSETEEIQECPAETDTAGEEDVSELETNRVIVTSTQVQAEEITEDLSATTDSADEEVEEQPLDFEGATPEHAIVTETEDGNLHDLVSRVASEESGQNIEGLQVTATALAQQLDIVTEDVDNQPVTLAESEVQADEVESDAEKVSQQSFISDEDQDEDADRQHKLSRSYETENGLIPDDNISLEEKSEGATKNMVSPVQQNVVILDDKDNEHDVEDTSDETLITSNKEIVEVAALPPQEDVNTADVQEEGFEREDAESPSPSMEDQLILEDKTIDGVEEDVEEGVSSVQHTTCISDKDEATEVKDASYRDPEDNTEDEIREASLSEEDSATGEENEPHADSHEEEQEKEEKEEESLLVQQKTHISDEDEASDDHDRSDEDLKEDDQRNSDDNVRDGASEDVEEEVLPIEHSASMLENDEAGVVEDTSHAASLKEQLLVSDDNVRIMGHEVPSVQQTVYIPEDQRVVSDEEAAERASLQSDDHVNFSDSVHGEDKGGISTSPLQQNFSIPDEEDDGTNSHEEGIRSCQTLEVGEVTVDTVGLESMVATGQVFSSRADRGATGSNFVPGQFDDDDTNLPSHQTTVVPSTKIKEEEDLVLEKAEAEGLFEIREGLVNASAQAAPTCYSGAEVVNEILAPVLETHLCSVETGGDSLISEEAEEAADLVQDESFNVTGETEGTACSTGAESEASYVVQEPEASGGQENPERQTLAGQTPRSKSMKSKADSQKSLQRSKSTSGKCKQQ